ncbi:hypothetical protein [Tianweitania sediminis]|uniref:Uncharacterized protein n=1 Tax=Tianweitania sediminis TaxID=1502156 RepID=A0A8J7RNM3_9HYPH|nr:hypothetical protein [Tianweitania sediminis]MBP0439119.1 hypothetical protein [Tianweitania sediminis]
MSGNKGNKGHPLFLSEFATSVHSYLDKADAKALGISDLVTLEISRPAAGDGGHFRLLVIPTAGCGFLRYEMAVGDPRRWLELLEQVRQDPDATMLDWVKAAKEHGEWPL